MITKYITFNSWDNIDDFSTDLKPNVDIDQLVINLPNVPVELKTSDLIDVIAKTFIVQYPLSFEINETMNSNKIYEKWNELIEQLFFDYKDNMKELQKIIKKAIESDEKLLNYLETQALLNYVDKNY